MLVKGDTDGRLDDNIQNDPRDLTSLWGGSKFHYTYVAGSGKNRQNMLEFVRILPIIAEILHFYHGYY